MTDDDLILFHYREGLAPGEAARIEQALAKDAALAERYRALTADLVALKPVADSTVPPAALQRWQRALDRAAAPAAKVSPNWSFGFAAAFVLVLAAGFGVAYLSLRDTGTAAGPGTFTASLGESRYERGLAFHLADVESQLALAAELPVAERGTVIERLLQQNRLQAAAAERAGEDRNARLLRAFNATLEDMAGSRSLNGEFKGALAQLNFEMKVMQARLAASSPSTGAGRVLAL